MPKPRVPAPYAAFFDETGDHKPTHLVGDDRFTEGWHRWSDPERWALVHAWANERPLLVRGEPGCGKSQLARAAAAVLRVPLELEVIHPRFEATDLKYREDHVRRLAEAQVLAALKPDDGATDRREWIAAQLDRKHFIDHGAIWRAMTTLPPEQKAGKKGPIPDVWPRAVLLIDEIDKADSDIPNALLDVMGNRSFKPPAGDVVRCDKHFPLIIVTTNEERELPPAFLRRCAVLSLSPPRGADGKEDQTSFTAWLVDRAQAHEALRPLAGAPMQAAAAQTWADRSDASRMNLPTVGLAEYLDLMYSLLRLSGEQGDKALELLNDISPYALVKHREQSQGRDPVGAQAPKG